MGALGRFLGAQMREMAAESLNEKQRAKVLEELARVLASGYFNASHRCCKFLTYSVHYVLDARPPEDLKERVVGIEVFQKAADYDTAQDNIVRVTANEVRKRLAQYYGDGHPKTNPTISLPIGSYIVCFQWTAEESSMAKPNTGEDRPAPSSVEKIPVPQVRGLGFGWKIALFCILMLAVLVTAAVYRNQHTEDPVQRVWSPFLDSRYPIAICISEPLAFRPASGGSSLQGPPDHMVSMQGQLVGMGDTHALTNIVRVLSSKNKEWELYGESTMPSQVLFDRPTILIGIYDNKWTPELMNNPRFYFDSGGKNEIYDRSNPGVKWTVRVPGDWKVAEDYAIALRFNSPRTGQPVLVIAGVSTFGTEAAGDFISNPRLLAEAFHNAPKNWDKKNFEFVLETKPIGSSSGEPTVVAADFW
jgi:hypothetical protein